jgi:rare lipoprotein A
MKFILTLLLQIPYFVLTNYLQDPVLHKVFIKETTASYYAENFHGRLTAYGEIYYMYDMTAASVIFGHNTIVKVVYQDTFIIVRINDKGPFLRENKEWIPHPSRKIDLSKEAFSKLANLEKGLIKVKIYKIL